MDPNRRQPKDYLSSSHSTGCQTDNTSKKTKVSHSTEETGGAATCFWQMKVSERVLINSQFRNYPLRSLQQPTWPAICLQHSQTQVKFRANGWVCVRRCQEVTTFVLSFSPYQIDARRPRQTNVQMQWLKMCWSALTVQLPNRSR